jgi:hypothetical protein
MAELKFTPGPWRVNKYGSVGAGVYGCDPIVATREFFYGVDERFGDHNANARLIAAAPDLYAALTQLLHECIQAGFETATDYNWPKSLADARAALTAAVPEAETTG